MAVGLPVGRQVDEARYPPVAAEARKNPLEEILAASGEPPECYGMRQRAVVEEQGDGPARREPAPVGPRCIEPFGGHLGPFPAAYPADPPSLVRGQDGERDALAGQRLEGGDVDGALGEPHPLGLAAETDLEITDAPEDLGRQVAGGAERQDGVVVSLSDGVAVTAVVESAAMVGSDDCLVDFRLFGLEPREQSGAHVEAYSLEIVSYLQDVAI